MAQGYSGKGNGKNNPAMESVVRVGPIPCGAWKMTALTEGMTPHGPYVIHLEPCAGNTMAGRQGGFLIHGDKRTDPGNASEGCIIMPRAIREAVWASGDRALTVTT